MWFPNSPVRPPFPSISFPPFYIFPSLRFLSSLPSTLLPFCSLPSLPFLSLPPEPFSSIPFPSLLYHLLFFHFIRYIPLFLPSPIPSPSLPFPFPPFLYFSKLPSPSLFHKLKRNNIFYFLIMIILLRKGLSFNLLSFKYVNLFQLIYQSQLLNLQCCNS